MEPETIDELISNSDRTDDLTEDQEEELYDKCIDFLEEFSAYFDTVESSISNMDKYKQDLIRTLIKHKSKEFKND